MFIRSSRQPNATTQKPSSPRASDEGSSAGAETRRQSTTNPSVAGPLSECSVARLAAELDQLERTPERYFDGRVTRAVAERTEAFEQQNDAQLNANPALAARLQAFQARVGLSTRRFPQIPFENTPFWLEGPDPFAGFQSTSTLPARADFVILGAGLTGSAVLHLLLARLRATLGPALQAAHASKRLEAGERAIEAHPDAEKWTPTFRAALKKALAAAHASLVDAEARGSFRDHRFEEALDRALSDGVFDAASIVVLDKTSPCGGASGRNGGNRGLTENFNGTYEGIFEERVKIHMRARGLDVGDGFEARAPVDVLARAKQERDFILFAWDESRRVHEDIVSDTRAACDLKTGGWTKLADTPGEVAALARDAELLARQGIPQEIRSTEDIERELGIRAPYSGLRTLGATYHPVKYVRAVMTHNLERGGRLYTQAKVVGVDSVGPTEHVLRLERAGKTESLVAGTVVAALNAYVKTVFDDFDGVTPYRSQVAIYKNVSPTLGQAFLTRRQGDDYANHPNPTALIQGGGLDTPVDGYENPPVDPEVHTLLVKYADEKIGPDPGLELHTPGKRYRPPASEWTGLMGFTKQKLPYTGWLRPGVEQIGGYSGYGNTFALACARMGVDQITRNEVHPFMKLLDPRVPREATSAQANGSDLPRSKL